MKKSGGLALAASLQQKVAKDPDALFELRAAAPAIETFAAVLGGRGELAAELLTSPDITPPIRQVLTLILDPRFDTHPLGKLCYRVGITPGQFFAAFRDATLAKATIHALRVVAARLPQITTDLIADAVNHDQVCPSCSGSRQQLVPSKRGHKDELIPCVRCNGQGAIRVDADFDKQKFAFELAGVIKKGPAVQVNNLQDNRAISVTGARGGLAQLQQAVSGILFSRSVPLSSLASDDQANPSDNAIDAEVASVDNPHMTEAPST